MKGNIFALKLLVSYPDVMQYVIHTLLLFILFLYWEVLKNVTVAMMRHAEEAAIKVSSCQGRNVTKKGLLPGLLRSATCLLNVQIWSNL